MAKKRKSRRFRQRAKKANKKRRAATMMLSWSVSMAWDATTTRMSKSWRRHARVKKLVMTMMMRTKKRATTTRLKEALRPRV